MATNRRSSRRRALRDALLTFEGRMSLLCLALTFANFLAVYFLLEEDRSWYAAEVSLDSVLWWPAPDTPTYCLMFAPFLASMLFALSEKHAPAARGAVPAMALTFAMMVAADFGAVSSGVAVQPDQITWTRWGVDRVIRLNEVSEVEVGCDSQWSRRGGHRAYPVYDLVLTDGEKLSAGDASGWRPNWLIHLATLDEQLALIGVVSAPHRNLFGASTDLSRCRARWTSWTSGRDPDATSAVASIFERVQTSADRIHPFPLPG